MKENNFCLRFVLEPNEDLTPFLKPRD